MFCAANDFRTVTSAVAGRTQTTASCQWHMAEGDGWTIGAHLSSPDMSAVVSEVINRLGWKPGNGLVLIIQSHAYLENLMAAITSTSREVSRRSDVPR